jgi:hypothetical protein
MVLGLQWLCGIMQIQLLVDMVSLAERPSCAHAWAFPRVYFLGKEENETQWSEKDRQQKNSRSVG